MRNVVIGFLGTKLDAGKGDRWRPTVSLVDHDDFEIDRIEILYDHAFNRVAHRVKAEIEARDETVEVRLVRLDLANPWDFQEVYGKLFDFARDYGFDEDRERYHVHLTTGTHVAQICWFLLTESRHVPAQLLQTGPPRRDAPNGHLQIIDLDLRRYDALQQRFDVLARENSDMLKGGIETVDAGFNALIDEIELVVASSDAPVLLMGESGTGKSALAERIHALKLQNRRVKGRLVSINCATLTGGVAAATLFGQRRAHNGAGGERRGLLREADGGVLFLDEIDTLGLDEQALLLHAIETGRYYPLGSDHEVTSRFHVIASASRDLVGLVADGVFRPDLLARLNTWTFTLPPLRERRADMDAFIAQQIGFAERELGQRVGFNSDAADAYLRFARAPSTRWPGNFRDLAGSILRLCTLAPRGRVTRAMVDAETERLETMWTGATRDPDAALLREVLGERVATLDRFERAQLADVIRACRESRSLSEAGRALFAQSLAERRSANDADRLGKYLARHGLDWRQLIST